MKLRLAIVFLLAATGCSDGDDGGGTGSGVDGGKSIGTLSASEQQDLCEYTVDAEGGARTVQCDGFTVDIDDVDECVASLGEVPATCAATVADAEACAAAIGEDPCRFDSPACQPLFACAG